MEFFVIIAIIVFFIWIFSNNSSSGSSPVQKPNQTPTPSLAELNRQAEERRRREEEQRRADEQRRAEEQRRRDEERRRAAAERERLAAQQRLREQQEREEQARIIAQRSLSYKANWNGFDIVVRQRNIKKLYHFTDRSNLNSIRANGGLYSWFYCQQNNIHIPRPGGSSTSWALDKKKGLENYVRVSFVTDHPMLYIAKQDGRIGSSVLLEIDPSVIYLRGTKYALQNAAKNGVPALDTLDHFQQINFSLLRKRYFDLSEVEKPYYQAEVLVLEKISLEYILNINNV